MTVEFNELVKIYCRNRKELEGSIFYERLCLKGELKMLEESRGIFSVVKKDSDEEEVKLLKTWIAESEGLNDVKVLLEKRVEAKINSVESELKKKEEELRKIEITERRELAANSLYLLILVKNLSKKIIKEGFDSEKVYDAFLSKT